MIPNDFVEKQKVVLLAVEERLRNGNSKKIDRSDQSTSHGRDLADASSFVTEIDNIMSLASNQRQTLQEVQDALVRVSNGTYGVCEISGVPIPVERLEAIPWARYTVKVQAELEKDPTYKSKRRAGKLFEEASASDDEDAGEAEEEEATKEK